MNGCIQSFLNGAGVKGFFWVHRDTYPVTRKVLRDVANDYHNWVASSAQKWGAEIVSAPEGRRADFVEPYFQNAQPDQVVVISKAREPAGIYRWVYGAFREIVDLGEFRFQFPESVLHKCSGQLTG